MKKIISILLILTLVLANVPSMAFASTSVIIHYHRDDNNYEGWQIWGWAEGKDGKDFEFTEEDAFGAVAYIDLAEDAEKMGFIIKTADWTKDVGDDRFIDLSQGNEVWVTSEQAEFLYEAPEGYATEKVEKNFKIDLVYDRYDNDYSNVTLVYKEKNNEANTATINITSNEAVVFDVKAADNLIFSVLKDGVAQDFEDSIIFTSKVEEGGTLPVTLEQGVDKVNYEKLSTVANVEYAVVTDVDKITVTLSKPVQLTGGLEGFSIDGLNIKSVVATNAGSKYVVPENSGYGYVFDLVTDEVDFSKTYTVKKEGLEATTETTLGNIFDTEKFIEEFTYTGDDLGYTYTSAETKFRVWAPTAKSVKLYTYNEYKTTNTIPSSTVDMVKDVNGTWVLTLAGDQKGLFYNYEVVVNGQTNVATDPYAKAVNLNGNKGVVIDLEETNPEGFDAQPELKPIEQIDSIIYEVHVRDLSMNESSGITNKGDFLGFTEKGTKNADGQSTGLDHILDLGVTHIHLLPSFDFASVDEEKTTEFNWGYDPKNYNVPEGSYATDPYAPDVRVNEFKEMVQTLHENDLRVVMDVVYNHMSSSGDSGFEKIVPGYYFRTDANGAFTNGSGCGNETASDRPMMQKFIVDSVKYWATEYDVDGFRFDLMALHDIETINLVREELDKIDPSIIVYGEGWTAGGSPLATDQQALKANAKLVNSRVAFFSDDIRDGIKGSVFNAQEPGFVSGSKSKKDDVMFGIVGSVKHPQVSIGGVDYSSDFWAAEPTQTINYASAHDNLTLYDKLTASTGATDEEIIAMNKMSAAIVLTSQGIPFFQAGEELARTKNGDENSYKSSDSVNSIKWDTKTDRLDIYEYYKGLIALRKETKAFRLGTTEAIVENLVFNETDENTIAYTVNGQEGDKYSKYVVAFNPTDEPLELTVEKANYVTLVNKDTAGTEEISSKTTDVLVIAPHESFVAGVGEASNAPSVGIIIGGVAVIAIAAVGCFVMIKKRKN